MSRQDILENTREGSIERELFEQIDLERLPRHVAIIMDGNGRWAQKRGLPRVEGHRAGIASVREVVETCARLDLQVLTLYAFSVENWKRPKTEIDVLMKLLKQYLRLELSTLIRNDIRFRVLGRMPDLPDEVVGELDSAMERTRNNRGLQFNIALNYGGRTEIVDACREIVREALARGNAGNAADSPESPENPENLDSSDSLGIDEATFASHLYTAGMVDPDLLIRTSGELRISNFLLWQIAYAEIWVTETLWPDFRKRDLFEAIIDFQKRERRYGGIAAAAAPTRSTA